MNILIFDGKRLYDANAHDGKHWRAVSGPYGLGLLPAGVYKLGKAVEIAREIKNQPYMDPLGFAWWCGLTATFPTPRSGFGIHPDGNVPGTAGCVGIKGDNTRSCFEYLASLGDAWLVVLPEGAS